MGFPPRILVLIVPPQKKDCIRLIVGKSFSCNSRVNSSTTRKEKFLVVSFVIFIRKEDSASAIPETQ